MKYARVENAYTTKGNCIGQLFTENNISEPEIFLRIFKMEERIEVWSKNRSDDKFKLITSYFFCWSSGDVGPKRRQGDYQIPEGFYEIDTFNPESKFHLSLGINYPNESDRILSNSPKLGGDIFIHGDCFTVGCIPITNDWMEELYIIAIEAKNKGQETIPVHIFPAVLDNEDFSKIVEDSINGIDHSEFWNNLKEGYDYFEKNKTLPEIKVSDTGKYIFK